jgi:phosphonate transport system permease protein
VSNPALNPARRPAAFAVHWPARLAWTGLGLYVLYAAGQINVSWERIISGLPQATKLLSRMFPPNMAADKMDLITTGMLETVQIAVIATVVGVLLSLPLSIMAARNLSPGWLAGSARVFIAVCRSFHPVIVSILFVKAVGFGALAGVLALIVSSMGFIGKLFAEVLEELNEKQVEAVRSTGAGFFSVLIMAVMPQVFARFIGLSAYQFDSNLRNSTMVGIVGGGGIGAALFTAYQRFDYDVVLTILIVIIALIMLAELLANGLKKIFR